MSRSLSRVQAVLLGVVVLAGLGLGALGLFAIGSRQLLWADTLHLRAAFPDVRGIEVGARVRVRGVNAGEVVDVKAPAAPGEPIVVRMRLEGQFRSLIRTDATAQIQSSDMIGGRVIELFPGTSQAAPVAEDATLASRPSVELADVLDRVDGALQDFRNSEATISKLMKDDSLYHNLNSMARQGTSTLESIQQDADALKKMPIVRSYVQDAKQLLVRPDCERYRQAFAERELFEPGKAILTAAGQKKLDGLVPWLEGLRHTGSDVVVVSAAAGGSDAELARTCTSKQSEAVIGYLKDRHGVHKNGWFSRSWKMTPLGLGTAPPPQVEKEQLPPPHIEVLVFVPRS